MKSDHLNTEITESDIVNILAGCARALQEKKAEDILALNLLPVNNYFDYFIICTANSRIHARSLSKEVMRYFSETVMCQRNSPDTDSEWILLDYSEIVIHIFTSETREYYGLERLWADADVIEY